MLETGSGAGDVAAAVVVTALGSVLMVFACLAAAVARLLGATVKPREALEPGEIENA